LDRSFNALLLSTVSGFNFTFNQLDSSRADPAVLVSFMAKVGASQRRTRFSSARRSLIQYSRLAAASISICAVTMLASLTAIAQNVSFFTTTYAGNNLWSQNNGPNGHIRADLNRDGREDFISENDASCQAAAAARSR
jgi:hypothetical protein